MQKTMERGLVVVAVATMLTVLAARASENAQDVLENVRKKYDSIVDAQVKFSQTITFEVANVEQNATGVLLFKKSHKYRVEFDDLTIVTDGEIVWKYSIPQKQVLIDRLKIDDLTFSPEQILTGTPTGYTPSVLGKERLGRTETVVLKLTASREDAFVQSLKLWIDESTWLIKKVDYGDVSGKRTEYTVNDIKINIGLDDSRFAYQVPEGVEVVDLR
jgi:outer membrane lipoprotein carrier protein